MTLSGKLGDVILHFNEAHFDQGLESSGLTGDKFVRLALISRNTQRRWIALSKLNPASRELGWSVMGLSSFSPHSDRLRRLALKRRNPARSAYARALLADSVRLSF